MNEILKENSYEENKIVQFVNFEGKFEGELSYGEVFDRSIQEKHELILICDGDIPKIKMVNYGKMLYDQKKKMKNQKKQIQEQKEIKFGLNIGPHDYEIKLKKIKEFLSDNVKVKATIQMNGREVEHPDFAIDMMKKIIKDLENYGFTEDELIVNNRFLSVNFKKVK